MTPARPRGHPRRPALGVQGHEHEAATRRELSVAAREVFAEEIDLHVDRGSAGRRDASHELDQLPLANRDVEVALLAAGGHDRSSREPRRDDEQQTAEQWPVRVGGPMGALRLTLRWSWRHGHRTKTALVASVVLYLFGNLLLLAYWLAWLDLSLAIPMTIAILGSVMGGATTVMAWATQIRHRLQALAAGHRASGESDVGLIEFARHRVEAQKVEVEQCLEEVARAQRQLRDFGDS